MSTALDTELAVEYLMSKETVTNTRLSSLGALHRAVEAGRGEAPRIVPQTFPDVPYSAFRNNC